MRIAVAILLLGLGLAACEQVTRGNRVQPTSSSFIHREFRTFFRSVAPAEYLGEAWAQQGGADAVRRVWADPGGQRALLLLRGGSSPAIWLDLEKSRLATTLQLEHPPLHVDARRGVAYSADGPRLLARSLPAGEWETRFGAESGEVAAVATHRLRDWVWVVVQKTTNAADIDGDEPHVMDTGQRPPLPPAVKQQHGDPEREVIELTALRLDDDEPMALHLPLPARGSAEDIQLCALGNGRAFAAVDGHVFLLDPDSGAKMGSEVFASERPVLLAADVDQDVAWVYSTPRGSSQGTGRSAREAVAGAVLAFDAAGTELGRTGAGEVRFSQLAGNWRNRSALLCRDGSGVLALDVATGEARWALRDSGEAALQLVGGGTQLWTLLPDGISALYARRLLELSPELAASRVVPREQLAALREAVEALGWDWKRVQLSPLAVASGRYTLFNTADPASELAELDWSPSRRHVSRLLIARPANAADAQFAALPGEVQRQHLGELLASLGWPEAQVAEPVAPEFEDGLGYTCVLNPAAPEGYSPGTLTLWQGESVLMTLDAATAELPANALDLSAVREHALAALPESAAGPRIEAVQAGWYVAGRDRLLPEGEPGALPAYEVLAQDEQPECREYRLLLHAFDGKLLSLHEQACGPGK